jgi:hypothetical protein
MEIPVFMMEPGKRYQLLLWNLARVMEGLMILFFSFFWKKQCRYPPTKSSAFGI